ncbi:MAG: hypothetical protein HLUCCX14_05945 [Marinobacter excellens HL-55]|uniref:Uncharacterized protein n=1 Tax=Marinobacter excellens HL-55 TaxID=1305731 RepID=A0A0P8BLS5_9GAMM|nr:MAG: hypothetical protein HLUCCX14_05945 [Marinobacter excellens HL-55]
MKVIAHQELQGVLTRRQLQSGLGLPAAKMNVALIRWDWCVQCRQVVYINQQVMVSGFLAPRRPVQRPSLPGQTVR